MLVAEPQGPLAGLTAVLSGIPTSSTGDLPNVLEAIPPPLRDRMEVMDLPGYTEEDKLVIARQFLIARQVRANGLGADRIIEVAARSGAPRLNLASG